MARGYSNAGGGVVLDSELDLNSQNGVKNSVITTAINSKANQDTVDQISDNLTSLEATVQQNTDDITNVDATVNSLADVARTGSYNDLIDKPAEQEVPTINNSNFSVAASEWESNSDSATSTAFPYKASLPTISVVKSFDAADTGYNVNVNFDPASAVAGKLAGFCTFVAVAGSIAGTTDVTVTIYSNDNTIAPTGYATVMHS